MASRRPGALSQDQVQPASPTTVKLTEAAVLVAVRMDLLVLLPQLLQGHMTVVAEFLVDGGEVRWGASVINCC